MTGCWRTDVSCQEAILCTATVMPSCFWIIMFPLSDSKQTTGISVGSEVSLAACWARTDITPACSSDRVPRQPRLSPCESVHRTPTMDGFFIVSSKCCSKVGIGFRGTQGLETRVCSQWPGSRERNGQKTSATSTSAGDVGRPIRKAQGGVCTGKSSQSICVCALPTLGEEHYPHCPGGKPQ